MENIEVLIVEDDPVARLFLQNMVSSIGLKQINVDNGKAALDIFNKIHPLLVITDLEMPVMGGEELIDNLNGFEDTPVIIVQTVHKDSKRIIDVMRRGVYDYFLKPIDVDDFSIKMKRAYEHAILVKAHRSMEKEKIIRLENELEWYRWHERACQGDMDKIDRSIFSQLNRSFNQGAGFGALVTLLDMVSSTAKKVDNEYLIDGKLAVLIQENVKHSRKILQTFAEINQLESNTIEMSEIPYKEFFHYIEKIISKMKSFTEIRNQKILISDMKTGLADYRVSVNRKIFKKMVKEIIINALKFSPEKSTVYVFIDVKMQHLQLSIMNDPLEDAEGRLGIPLGYENLVFEPFFRMTKTVSEKFETLDYGLGLPLVEKIVKKHNGKITISNIMDYTKLKSDPECKILASVSIPLQ